MAEGVGSELAWHIDFDYRISDSVWSTEHRGREAIEQVAFPKDTFRFLQSRVGQGKGITLLTVESQFYANANTETTELPDRTALIDLVTVPRHLS
jgi:hypothetical protein